MAKVRGHPAAVCGNTEKGEAQLISCKRSPDQDVSSEEARQGRGDEGNRDIFCTVPGEDTAAVGNGALSLSFEAVLAHFSRELCQERPSLLSRIEKGSIAVVGQCQSFTVLNHLLPAVGWSGSAWDAAAITSSLVSVSSRSWEARCATGPPPPSCTSSLVAQGTRWQGLAWLQMKSR